MVQHIFVQGSLGAGKTLIASTLAHWWKLKVEQQLGGQIELFSNYELDDSTPMTHYTDWYKVAEAQGSICVWDECYTAFSNRNWNSYGQNILNDVMMLTRKMKAIQIYCSPSINFVDTRLRSIVEILITARKIGDAGFEYVFHDYQSKQFMHKQFLPMYKAKSIMKVGLYDTDQMVRHFPVPTNERQGNEFFEKLEEIHDRARAKKKGRFTA